MSEEKQEFEKEFENQDFISGEIKNNCLCPAKHKTQEEIDEILNAPNPELEKLLFPHSVTDEKFIWRILCNICEETDGYRGILKKNPEFETKDFKKFAEENNVILQKKFSHKLTPEEFTENENRFDKLMNEFDSYIKVIVIKIRTFIINNDWNNFIEKTIGNDFSLITCNTLINKFEKYDIGIKDLHNYCNYHGNNVLSANIVAIRLDNYAKICDF